MTGSSYLLDVAGLKMIPYLTIILDSPMAVEITKVFEHYKEYFDDETRKLFTDGQSLLFRYQEEWKQALYKVDGLDFEVRKLMLVFEAAYENIVGG